MFSFVSTSMCTCGKCWASSPIFILKKIFILCVCMCSEEEVGSLKLQAVMWCWELNLGPPIEGVCSYHTRSHFSRLPSSFLMLSFCIEREARCIS